MYTFPFLDSYGGEDVNIAAVASVNSILNGALGGTGIQQPNGNSLAATANGNYGLHHHNSHQTDHSGGGSMGRSHSSSSTGSSGTGDHATPPALQGGASAAAAAANHQLQAAMAHQMALSHYNSASFGTLAAFNNHLRSAAAAGAPPSVGGNLRRYPCKLCPAVSKVQTLIISLSCDMHNLIG